MALEYNRWVSMPLFSKIQKILTKQHQDRHLNL